MLASIASATVKGITGQAVTVEVHVGGGLPAFNVVGLPDASCREARDRVRAALLCSVDKWPPKKITVNLAPSGVRKVGAGLDLAIAIGVLVANGDLDVEAVSHTAFLAELGLDGSLRRVPGVLSLVTAAAEAGAENVVVAPDCVAEAELAAVVKVRAATNLGDLYLALRGEAPWIDPEPPLRQPCVASLVDLAEVAGHPLARAALEIAAAGGHNLLMVGPPGSGKTMLAKRLPGILPRLQHETAIETTKVHSVAGLPLPAGGLVRRPPFRAPHHSASIVALVGGGTTWLRPGEISCAHGGVLFLDEMGEFPPAVLDALRQPLEEGVIRVSRAIGTVTFPASFLLVGAMNPCPCGHLGSPGGCRCTEAARARYSRRLSGPLLDRFDLRVHMHRPSADVLLSGVRSEPSAAVADRVRRARLRAEERGVRFNAELTPPQLDRFAPLDPPSERLVRVALTDGRLSARGLARIRAVALTICDLAGRDGPDAESVALALGFRTAAAPHESVEAIHAR